MELHPNHHEILCCCPLSCQLLCCPSRCCCPRCPSCCCPCCPSCRCHCSSCSPCWLPGSPPGSACSPSLRPEACDPPHHPARHQPCPSCWSLRWTPNCCPSCCC